MRGAQVRYWISATGQDSVGTKPSPIRLREFGSRKTGSTAIGLGATRGAGGAMPVGVLPPLTMLSSCESSAFIYDSSMWPIRNRRTPDGPHPPWVGIYILELRFYGGLSVRKRRDNLRPTSVIAKNFRREKLHRIKSRISCRVRLGRPERNQGQATEQSSLLGVTHTN